ncbi:hypothetical protein [Halobacillus sp. H74]|uniref:hypothetical protein n=1 Tax=Halobacillus sp. H74 TaxID=3457436 RepID=UPI003FCEC372
MAEQKNTYTSENLDLLIRELPNRFEKINDDELIQFEKEINQATGYFVNLPQNEENEHIVGKLYELEDMIGVEIVKRGLLE